MQKREGNLTDEQEIVLNHVLDTGTATDHNFKKTNETMK
jgi:hypothetical protein